MKQIFMLSFALILLSGSILAQIPRTLSFQGVLTDSSGTPRVDADYDFTFSLYDSITGGTLLWAEIKSLDTKRGLFNTSLGDAAPFPDSLKFDRPYWLSISVQSIGELLPRLPLSSAPYSLSLVNNGMWIQEGINLSRVDGNVGIGTSHPTQKLHIAGDDPDLALDINSKSPNNWAELRFRMDDTLKSRIYWNKTDNRTYFDNMGKTSMVLEGSNVGIGTTNPVTRLHLASPGSSWGNPRLLIENTQEGADQVALAFRCNGIYDWEFGAIHDGRLILRDQESKKSILSIYPGSSSKLVVNGRTVTDVLEIVGGSDLAEPFPISSENHLEEGSVVVIDESNPGHVMLSNESYDKKVAGVVSGAGGIKPGLTLKQEGLMEGGQNIALSGRVYVKATASNGPIKPGDRLVTSSIPGLSMKATDDIKSIGSVIGKAMTSLNEGEGLVLVLVNLQ